MAKRLYTLGSIPHLKELKKVESRNFDIRKNLLKFDNVMNDQRKVIFDQRLEILKQEDLSEIIKDMRVSIKYPR